MEVDRISNLPLGLTQKILDFLPLREAAKTSVFSKTWRFQWASIPHLILDESFCKNIEEGRYKTADKSMIYSNAVNNILVSCVGPITKFVLYVPSWYPDETYKWIRCVCAKHVKELSLEFDPSLQKDLPTCLFTCSGLTHLTLIECKLLSLPPTFEGFPHLIYLEFCRCRWMRTEAFFEAKVLEILISKCPQLESLHLILSSPQILTIHAPKLKTLFMDGYLHRLCLAKFTAINTISLNIYLSSGMNEIFNCFANVDNLVLGEYFWEDFDYCRNIQNIMGRLRVLKLVGIPLDYQSYISFFLCLIGSSPMLEQLYIKVSEHGEDWANDDQLIQIECSNILQRLRKVQLCGISGWSGELKLLKHILAHSPVLEEMSIELSKNMGIEEKYNFAMLGMRYRRASTNAEIIIKNT